MNTQMGHQGAQHLASALQQNKVGVKLLFVTFNHSLTRH